MSAAIAVEDLYKTFTLHTQGGQELSVLRGVHLAVEPGKPWSGWPFAHARATRTYTMTITGPRT